MERIHHALYLQCRDRAGIVASLRWSRSVGQFDGLVKLGPGYRQAANLINSPIPYASSGVWPPSPEWGLLAL